MRSYRVGDEPIPGYKMLKKLGSGGFGEVWKASAPGGAELALKVISLGRKQGYKEFRALNLIKHIHHPNLTPIHAFWLKDEEGYVLDAAEPTRDALLMPPGQKSPVRATMIVESPVGQPAELIIAMGLGSMSLYDRLMQCRSQGMPGIPPGELLEYMEEAAKAIDFLNSPIHELGSGPIAIQHCDIKPQNILLVGNSAQVCDFGLARGVDDIRTSAAAGSPAYSPPECISANKPSPQTDQYSLAISYYELRTGELPFEDDTSYMAVATAHLNGKLIFTGLPEDERRVVQRATALNPADRFESTVKMVRALRRACPEAEEASIVPPPPSSEMDVGNGYRLVEPLVRGAGEEIWAAVAPGGKKVAVLVRHLKDPVTVVDQQALTLTRDMRHGRLAEIHGWWFLDSGGRVIPDNLRGTPGSATPSKLIMVGKLAPSTLAQRLQEERDKTGSGIPAAELLRYMDHLAEAIDYLNSPRHSIAGRTVSIQHCNLRPANFLIEDGGVKLGNFALAKVMSGKADTVNPDTLGAESPYVAPEVLEGRLSPRSDQFVLAVNYLHLRTGKLPFDPAGSTRTIVEQQRAVGLDLSRLIAEEANVVRRATSDDPSDRYESCRELVSALRGAINRHDGLTDSRATEIFSPDSGSAGFKPGANIAGTAIALQTDRDLASMTAVLTQTPPGPTETQPLGPAAAAIERQITKPETAASVALPVKRRGGRKFAAAALLFLACGGAGAAVYFTLPGNDPAAAERKIVSLVDQKEFAQAWDLATQSIPPLSSADGQRLKDQVLSSWLGDLQAALNATNQLPDLDRPAAVNSIEQSCLLLLERVPAESSAEELLASVLSLKQDGHLAGLRTSLATAQKLFETSKYPEAAQAFSDVVGSDLARGTALESQARLGRARAKARMRAWKDVQVDVEQLAKAKELDQSTRTILDSLQAIVVSAVSPNDPLKSLQALRPLYQNGKLIGSVEKLPERSLIEEAKQQTIGRVLKQNVIPNEQRDLATELQPGIFDISGLLAEAKKSLDDNQFAKARELLGSAAKLSPNANHPQVAELDWLIELKDPAGDVATTATALSQAVDADKLPVALSEIAVAIADHATATAEYRPLALNLLEKSFPYYAGPELATLHGRHLALFKISLLDRVADSKLDFAALAKELASLPESAQSDGLVNLVLAECLLESKLAENSRIDRATADVLSTYLDRTEEGLDEQVLPYGQYVRALTYSNVIGPSAREKGLKELTNLAGSLASKNAPVILQVPTRKRRASQMLFNAASQLRTAFDAESVDSLLGNPFGTPENAQQAYGWLKTAGSLLTPAERSIELQASFVLSAYHRGQGDLEEARAVFKDVASSLDRLPPEIRLPILVVQSKIADKTPVAQIAALHGTADVAAPFLSRAALPDRDVVRIYRELLEPTLKQADGSTSKEVDFGKALARVLNLKGQFMRRFPYADWSLSRDEREQQIFDAFNRAISLDKAEPDYLVGRGKSYLGMKKPDLVNAIADADAALKLRSGLPEALGLQGHCRILLSREQRSVEKRTEYLDQAIRDLKQAVAGAVSQESESTIHYINLSAAYVDWASNVIDPTYEKQKKLLFEAVNYANQAVESNRRHPKFAYQTLGNAYEDLAWMIGHVDRSFLKYYDNAIESFNLAIDEDPDDLTSYLYRARSNYKRVVDSGQDEKYLADAKKDLEYVLSDKTAAQNAEAHFWIGRVHAGLAKPDLADQAFAKAVEIAGKDSVHSALYVYDRINNAINSDLGAKQRAEQVRDLADELQQCKPSEGKFADLKSLAAFFRGKSYEVEGDHKEALKTYLAALPEKLEDTSGSAEEQLLLAAAGAKFKLNDFAGAQKDALTLAKIGSNPPTQAVAYGVVADAAWKLATRSGFDVAKANEARDHYRKALSLYPQARDSALWRDALVKILYVGMKNAEPAARKRDGGEALALIDQLQANPKLNTTAKEQLKKDRRLVEERIKTGK